MRVTVTQRPVDTIAADAVVSAFVGAQRRARLPLSTWLRPDASRLVARGEDAVTWFDTRDAKAPRALLVSLGDFDILAGLGGEAGSFGRRDERAARRHRARAFGALVERSCRSAGLRRIVLAELPVGMDPALVVEGILLSAHRTTTWQTVPKRPRLEKITLAISEAASRQDPDLAKRVARQVSVARATNVARELADMPSNHGDPAGFATAIIERAEAAGLGTRVIGIDEATELGMGLFCAVAAGGRRPGRLVVLEHDPPPGDADDGPSGEGSPRTWPLLGLVGKGVTHDLGGYNVKRSAGLHAMTYDKAGAAAVVGAMLAIAELELPLQVIAVLPIAENGLDHPAYKPGDVLTAMDGTSVFVDNTDAEGRLMMADALCWLGQFEPDLTVDVATLTGTSAIALGEPYAALFVNDDDARDRVQEAGERSGDRVWTMPIHDLHDREIGHHKADLRNANSNHRYGSASIAAAFLRQFVDAPWAHVDMGGKASWESPREVLGVGATGFGTRLLVELAQDFSARVPEDHT